jgi:hypothetical protein
MTPDGSFLAGPASRIGPFSPSRFGPVTDEHVISKGAWEYAHFYDPAGV